MNSKTLVFAFALIIIGLVGLVAVGCQSAPGFAFPNGMMGNGGMMGGGLMNGGMMGGMHGGLNAAPNVNVTPDAPNQPIDRDINITARNFQFDPPHAIVRKGETVKFVIANQDAFAHNFVSQPGGIPYTLLPANATVSLVWRAPQEAKAFDVLCTYHPGMRIQIVGE